MVFLYGLLNFLCAKFLNSSFSILFTENVKSRNFEEKNMNAEERAKAIRKFFWGKNAEKNLDAMAIFIESIGGGKFERKKDKTN
jgi:hypothetical protein